MAVHGSFFLGDASNLREFSAQRMVSNIFDDGSLPNSLSLVRAALNVRPTMPALTGPTPVEAGSRNPTTRLKRMIAKGAVLSLLEQKHRWDATLPKPADPYRPPVRPFAKQSEAEDT
jgi:hypothetical protein